MPKVFSWAVHGTLEVDGEISHVEAFNAYLKELGIPRHYSVQTLLGPDSKKHSWNAWVKEFEPEIMDIQGWRRKMDELHGYYELQYSKKSPGVYDVLNEIKRNGDINVAVSTDTAKSVKRCLELHRLDPFFSAIYSVVDRLWISDGTTEGIRVKNVPIKKQFMLEAAGGRPLYAVGDSEDDMEAGKEAGAAARFLVDFETREFGPREDGVIVVGDLREVVRIVYGKSI